LSMLPIEDRAINIPKSKIKRRVSFIDKLKFMVRDEAGNLVPPGPGQCIGLDALPGNHPAIEYLAGRGFDPNQLATQFDASYCVQENPDVFYKKLPGGFKASPQGRVVFFIKQLGVCRGWQARQLDRWQGEYFQMFHPYQNRWVSVAERRGKDLVMLPGFSGSTIGKPDKMLLKQKYAIGLGVEKTTMLMGFDAALRWSKQTGRKTIGIVEGVLDAAKLGPPFCSIMGLTLSTNQAALISNHFERVVAIPDNDVDSENREKFVGSINRNLGSKGVNVNICKLPEGCKDAGEMSFTDVQKFNKRYVI
jgi:hypothetical protein